MSPLVPRKGLHEGHRSEVSSRYKLLLIYSLPIRRRYQFHVLMTRVMTTDMARGPRLPDFLQITFKICACFSEDGHAIALLSAVRMVMLQLC
jgi:hypothetical protein